MLLVLFIVIALEINYKNARGASRRGVGAEWSEEWSEEEGQKG
jgi:hypothetical protein